MSISEPRAVPLRPDFAARDREQARDQARSLRRAITAVAQSGNRNGTAEKVVAKAWPNDRQALMLIEASEREWVKYTYKAAVTPPTRATSGIPSIISVDVLPSLAPQSAAVRLFARCLRVNLDSVNQISVPRRVPGATPPFIAEGGAMPVLKLSFTSGVIGPTRTIRAAAAVSNELENAGPEIASDLIGRLIAEDITRGLDAITFDTGADDGVRPAGLLHGLSPQIVTAGGGINALAKDLANLAGAIAAAGVSSDDMMIVTNPKQAVQLNLLSGPNFNYPVFGTPAVADKRVIAIVPAAVASAYSGVPVIEKATNPAIHFEDTSPADIVSAGGAAAAPVLSAFQHDMLVVRVRCNAAWSVVAPGIAYLDSVTW